ncbi:MAG: NAD(P)/FAD-dependent oxidoreductase [Thermodesulfobacteriota bacterium]
MAGKRVLIIGAGLAGLAAGQYARMNGYEARIFEHHTKPGGVVTCWKRGEYFIDGGIHWLMGYKPGSSFHTLYSELGILPEVSCLELTSYGRFVHEESGLSVEVTSDLDRLEQDLKSISPQDGRLVEELVSGGRAFARHGSTGMGLELPDELKGVVRKIQEFWGLRGVLKYFGGRFGRSAAQYAGEFRDPMLRFVVENLFLPDVPVWFVCMVLGLLAQRQMGVLAAGSSSLSEALAGRFVGLGGEISYGCLVEEILVKDDRALGIRLSDGSVHHGDVVISAADARSTILGMLKGRYVDRATHERLDKWELMRPMVMVNLGVAREFHESPSLLLIRPAHPLMIGHVPANLLTVRIFNYSGEFAPPGKTVVQAALETDWDWWHSLRDDPPRYREEKERIAAEVIKCLERHFPGIDSQVEMTDVATPYTFWRYTRNDRGAFMGWLPTPKALMTPIKRTLPGLDGFYMAGQWVTPGGGVPPCLYSGRHAIELICRKHGRPFKPGQA